MEINIKGIKMVVPKHSQKKEVLTMDNMTVNNNVNTYAANNTASSKATDTSAKAEAEKKTEDRAAVFEKSKNTKKSRQALRKGNFHTFRGVASSLK